MELIDGKATATAIKAEIAEEVKQIMANGGKQPHLAAVLVGHDGGSETYVKNKVLACEACGFKSTLIRYEDDITEEELLACVDKLNKDEDVDGFIVQLPLPKHIDEQKIIEAIDYRKDVDGFHPINVGRMAIGLPCFISATPLGIITLLKRYGVETSGKKCVVLGRSNIVGKPMAQLMMQKQYGDATVTVCHSHSKNLKKECQELKAELSDYKERGLIDAIKANPLKNYVITADSLSPQNMKNVFNTLVDNCQGYVGVFVGTDEDGYRYYAGGKDCDAKVLSGLMREKLGAKGGGSSDMIQGKADTNAGSIEEFWNNICN